MAISKVDAKIDKVEADIEKLASKEETEQLCKDKADLIHKESQLRDEKAQLRAEKAQLLAHYLAQQAKDDDVQRAMKRLTIETRMRPSGTCRVVFLSPFACLCQYFSYESC